MKTSPIVVIFLLATFCLNAGDLNFLDLTVEQCEAKFGKPQDTEKNPNGNISRLYVKSPYCIWALFKNKKTVSLAFYKAKSIKFFDEDLLQDFTEKERNDILASYASDWKKGTENGWWISFRSEKKKLLAMYMIEQKRLNILFDPVRKNK